MAKKKIVLIVGPTASGKTDLAHRIAKDFGDDIITADSRQVYKEMDIGTAKPHKTGYRVRGSDYRCPDIKGVTHYGTDLVKPNQYFSVQQWRREALRAIKKIQKQGRLPIIEGGTWQWIYTIVYGYTIPEVPPNKKLRAKLHAQAQKQGLASLVKRVLAKDPDAALFLDIHNPRRVIRALEVMAATKKPLSQLRKKGAPAFDMVLIGIDPGPQQLEKRIARRLKQQLRQGLQKEITALVKKYGWKAPGLSAIGYREWKPYFERAVSLHEVETRILRDTIKLSKVQRRMFQKIKNIKWVHTYLETKRLVTKFVRT